MARKWRTEAERCEFYLSKKVDRAIREFGMIGQGDRILLAVSGGKDSLGLVRLLSYGLVHSPAKYDLMAAHVRGDARGAVTDVPRGLVDWIRGEGIDLHVRDIIIPENEPLPMNCERCSRNRRRTLFEVARELGCNKVALGHNLEDFAYTALMNLLLFGRLETMAFSRSYFGGLFTVIRPLAYLREHELTALAKAGEFPLVESTCPMASASRRQAARRVMHAVSGEFRHAAMNIVRAARKNPPIGE
ncbi:MAG: ATP-binding protein [Armatimonadota bacterium]